MKPASDPLMEKIVSLSKRRGFIFPSSEIYGGLGSTYDYGPLGASLKLNIKQAWWQAMTVMREDIEGIDAAILMHPKVWEASGHVSHFKDPLIDCKNCKMRFRGHQENGDIVLEISADQILRGPQGTLACPECGKKELTPPRLFNLMFKTHIGPVENEGTVCYLRPETAQGIFVNFQNVLSPSRQKIPFGIAQIGKAFRNEITPGNFIFRTREFEQMEMQYFVKPGTDAEWFEKWKETRMNWYKGLGIKGKLDFHPHGPGELAHYAKAAVDIVYQFPFGPQEIEGIHNRTDFDLKKHAEFSGKDLNYFDEAEKTKYVPFVIETSCGVDRILLAVLLDSYSEEQVKGETRAVLRFHPRLAPYKAAILPLVKKDGFPEIGRKLASELRQVFPVFYDESGSIGRRYRRQDEIGTPFSFTIDGQTKEDKTVTVRDRDSMKQDRIAISKVAPFLSAKLGPVLPGFTA